jgi:trimethylguanosine synthase
MPSAASAGTRSNSHSPANAASLALLSIAALPASQSQDADLSNICQNTKTSLSLPAVIALDTSPVRLACAAHNAALYGVADRITFILADWVTWTDSYLARMEKGQVPKEEQVEVVFLSPPWGGIEYQTVGDHNNNKAASPPPKKRARVNVEDYGGGGAAGGASKLPVATTKGGYYPLAALAPLHGRDLFHLARRITPHVAYYLPRNVDLLELATLVDPNDAGERIEIEEEWMSGKLKAVTAYFGDLEAPEEI